MKSRIRMLANAWLVPVALVVTPITLGSAFAVYREVESHYCLRCLSQKAEVIYGLGPRRWGLRVSAKSVRERPSKAFKDLLDDRHEHDWYHVSLEVDYMLHPWGDWGEGNACVFQPNTVAEHYETSGAFRAALKAAVSDGQLDPLKAFGPKPKVHVQPGRELVDSREWPVDNQ